MKAAFLVLTLLTHPAAAVNPKCTDDYQRCMNRCDDRRQPGRCMQLCGVERRICAGEMLPRGPASFDDQYISAPLPQPLRRER